MNPIQFRFIPTADDYVQGNRRVLFQQRGMRLFVVVSAVVTLSTGLTVLLSLFSRATALKEIPALVLPIAFFPIIWLLILFVTPLQLRRNVQANERLRAETTGQASDAGLLLQTAFSETKMDWGTFAQLSETHTHFFLPYTVNRNMVQIIPKRAFASPQDVQAFRQAVNEKIGQRVIKGKASRSMIGSLSVVWVIVAALVIAYAVMAFAGAMRR